MELKEKEKVKLETIKAVVNKRITKKKAEEILNVTRRTIDRLIIKLKDEGEESFIHKNRGRPSNKKTPQEIENEIKNSYLYEYYDYNFTHYKQENKNLTNISYSTVYRILRKEDIISPEAQRLTKKEYNMEMKKAIEDEEQIEEKIIELYQSRLLAEEQAHIRKSTNYYKFGEEVQMDAAFDIWFGGFVSALHLSVDKATKKILSGWFDEQEITRGYFILIMLMIINYGIPKKIKTDNRKSFSSLGEIDIDIRKYRKLNQSQISNICKDLNIELDTSSNPLFKPNIERLNRTFEGRLKAELRHENIVDFEQANRYLNEVFIPKMNDLFSYSIDSKRTLMRENIYTEYELNIILSERLKRKIDNGCSIKYKSEYYQPIDSDGNIVPYAAKTEATLMVAYDYSLWLRIEGNTYATKKVEKYVPEKENIIIEKKKVKYIPPKNHPWRQYKNKRN